MGTVKSKAKMLYAYVITVIQGGKMDILLRVTSLEQLSVAEFSGEQVRPMFYEKGHKKVLGIWFYLLLRVKYSTIRIFKVIFLCQKTT